MKMVKMVRASLQQPTIKKIIKEKFEEERKQTHPTKNGKRR